MKPFLGIDVTTDKNNELFNGEEFLIQTPSAALASALDSSSEKALKTVEKANLPPLFRVMMYICGIAALLIVSGILRADASFAEGYKNAPWLYWAAGICAVTWLVLWLWSIQKSKTVLETEEASQTLSHLDSITRSIYAELAVPADAKDMDLLFFFYKIKDGEIKPVEKSVVTYFNPEFKIFTDEENLYLANLEGKYAFPLSSIVKIHTVKKHIHIPQWNKEEKYNKGIYKQYKLTQDNFDSIHCKYYHILEIHHQSETYGIYFPCYELPVLEALTGLKAATESHKKA